MKQQNLKEFDTKIDAEVWMESEVDDLCINNYRFAFLDDENALGVYENIRMDGCCGFFDEEVIVGGRKAKIGCNYGH